MKLSILFFILSFSLFGKYDPFVTLVFFDDADFRVNQQLECSTKGDFYGLFKMKRPHYFHFLLSEDKEKYSEEYVKLTTLDFYYPVEKQIGVANFLQKDFELCQKVLVHLQSLKQQGRHRFSTLLHELREEGIFYKDDKFWKEENYIGPSKSSALLKWSFNQ